MVDYPSPLKYESVVRTCSRGPCEPITMETFNGCRGKTRSYRFYGCSIRTCCDKDYCNKTASITMGGFWASLLFPIFVIRILQSFFVIRSIHELKSMIITILLLKKRIIHFFYFASYIKFEICYQVVINLRRIISQTKLKRDFLPLFRAKYVIQRSRKVEKTLVDCFKTATHCITRREVYVLFFLHVP